MKIVIAGGSGFIGKKVTETLLEEGHEILILTRNEKQSKQNIKFIQWLAEGTQPEKEIVEADVFINLAGVSINNGRWTVNHQKIVYESRITATDELIRIISVLHKKPSIFINASAIGIYPSSLDKIYTEKSVEIADDFLGRTVYDWEEKAGFLKIMGIRVAYMRFGVVLGHEGGALPLMVLPYRFFVGGTVGSGMQWVSWIHAADVARAILFVIKNGDISGPVNVTAPSPVRMNDFGKTIGSVLNRPHWLPVPAFILKLALGKKSSLVLEGQQVLPEVLKKEGFEFLFPSLASALEDLL